MNKRLNVTIPSDLYERAARLTETQLFGDVSHVVNVALYWALPLLEGDINRIREQSKDFLAEYAGLLEASKVRQEFERLETVARQRKNSKKVKENV